MEPSEPVPPEPSEPELEETVLVGSLDPLPELEVPELEVPELEVPELEVPELEVPELEVPELEVPELEVPELDGSLELVLEGSLEPLLALEVLELEELELEGSLELVLELDELELEELVLDGSLELVLESPDVEGVEGLVLELDGLVTAEFPTAAFDNAPEAFLALGAHADATAAKTISTIPRWNFSGLMQVMLRTLVLFITQGLSYL